MTSPSRGFVMVLPAPTLARNAFASKEPLLPGTTSPFDSTRPGGAAAPKALSASACRPFAPDELLRAPMRLYPMLLGGCVATGEETLGLLAARQETRAGSKPSHCSKQLVHLWMWRKGPASCATDGAFSSRTRQPGLHRRINLRSEAWFRGKPNA